MLVLLSANQLVIRVASQDNNRRSQYPMANRRGSMPPSLLSGAYTWLPATISRPILSLSQERIVARTAWIAIGCLSRLTASLGA